MRALIVDVNSCREYATVNLLSKNMRYTCLPREETHKRAQLFSPSNSPYLPPPPPLLSPAPPPTVPSCAASRVPLWNGESDFI